MIKKMNPTIIGFVILFAFSFYGLHQSAQSASKVEKAAANAANAAAESRDSSREAAATALAVRKERIERLVSTCTDANRRAKNAVTAAVKRDYILAAAIAPAPRDQETQDAVNKFVAIDARAVAAANPIIDCSPKALGITPLTRQVPVIPAPSVPAPARRSTIPTHSISSPPPTNPPVRTPIVAPIQHGSVHSESTTKVCVPLGKSGRCRKERK